MQYTPGKKKRLGLSSLMEGTKGKSRKLIKSIGMTTWSVWAGKGTDSTANHVLIYGLLGIFLTPFKSKLCITISTAKEYLVFQSFQLRDQYSFSL